MMNTLIISGGNINDDFALSFLKTKNWDKIIGVDKGMEFLYRTDIMPSDIVGDFDSVDKTLISHYENRENVKIHEFIPEKDFTDTQIALDLAIQYGSRKIYILGGTGTRLDHTMVNIQLLKIPKDMGIEACLVDEYNKISLIDSRISIRQKEQFGNYISLLPFSGQVTGVTLRGVKYPLTNHTIVVGESLGVSNEIIEEAAEITIEKGTLILFQSKDQ